MSIQDFKVLGPLGKGGFASVFKVERISDNKIYAMKRVNIGKMSNREVQDAVNEIRVLASIRHPNIVAFLQAFLNDKDKELCIIMEHCACGDLTAKIERYKKRKQQIDERVVWAYMIQMADALKCFHGKNILHRDIKAANCFLGEDGSIKVGDLNVAKRMKDNFVQTQIGTPFYMSPEVWSNKPYNFASDIWALGCTVYELLALKPPFTGRDFPSLRRSVMTGRFPPIPRNYSKDMGDVVASMLRLVPTKRPTAAGLLKRPEVAQRRNSEWFNKLPTHQICKDVSLIKTIQIPRNMAQLSNRLPKACYPDSRPDSPEAWPVTDRNRKASIEKIHGICLASEMAPLGGPKQDDNRSVCSSVRSGARGRSREPGTTPRLTPRAPEGRKLEKRKSDASSIKNATPRLTPRAPEGKKSERRPSGAQIKRSVSKNGRNPLRPVERPASSNVRRPIAPAGKSLSGQPRGRPAPARRNFR
eukprot:CAMPEP_0185756386 /NCGR_PEP_ID=MMETSP1174-20130828/14817_1 /TAXON_ID=35687 /ORGANISM="Dictyocha speculum, Strain CCMP1381" /LENGTH=472 /DNA_ID=CAMNT_0028435329 /DNA_START=15 /DNA_END=1433 /DNA_ORIENTATION=-